MAANKLQKANININNPNQNINIYKSSAWTCCIVNINNFPYKRVYAEELRDGIPYCIEMDIFHTMHSLLCDKSIVYQSSRWFEFKVEFVMSMNDPVEIDKDQPFYEYIYNETYINGKYDINKSKDAYYNKN